MTLKTWFAELSGSPLGVLPWFEGAGQSKPRVSGGADAGFMQKVSFPSPCEQWGLPSTLWCCSDGVK